MYATAKKINGKEIELNGPDEIKFMVGLLLFLPVWILTLFIFNWTSPLGMIGISTILFYYRNRLRFYSDQLKLPGTFGRSMRYDIIKRISIDPKCVYLKIEYAHKDGLKVKKVNIFGLNKESATALWTQLATRLRDAEIESTVRERLIDWRDPTLYLQQANNSKSFKTSKEAHILNFNERKRYSQIGVYLQTCGKVALRCWTGIWIVIAIETAIAMLLTDKTSQIAKVAQGLAIHSFFEYSQDLALQLFFVTWMPVGVFIVFAGQHLKNIWASCALLLIATALVCYLVVRARKANSLLFDENGLALLRKTPIGQTRLRSVKWSEITTVRMVLPQSIVGKQIGPTIELSVTDSPHSIKIPVGAFASVENRKKFIEVLHNLNENVQIDELVLETLAPRSEHTYTSLWLNAIQAAPQLNQLLPLKPGDPIEHHDLIIEKQFSSGGQAVTYLARKTDDHQSKVILKEFLLPLFIESAKKKTIERFKRDANLLKNLDHPQIVKLHDYFIEESRAFLMLEYIEGVSLKEKVEHEGKLSELDAINLAKQMATILDYLHTCAPPVVHRDFTPENLILSEDGLLKLIDFDVALAADQLNQQNNSAGKTHYLPPEQFRGQACPQSDIYALGATLFFLMTGSNPEPMQVNKPSDAQLEVSNSFDLLIAKCTEPDLNNRYQTASALADTLSELSSEKAI